MFNVNKKFTGIIYETFFHKYKEDIKPDLSLVNKPDVTDVKIEQDYTLFSSFSCWL